MSKPVIAALAVVLLAAGALTVVTAAVVFNRNSGDPEGPPSPSQDWRNVGEVKDFTLTERSGRQFDSKSLDGEVWVASFFFASCPTECTFQNRTVAALQREFGPKGVTFVSITCDPANDTPARLRDYANRFNADPDQWLFLTGDLSDIQRIGKERFKLPVEQSTHSSRLVVVDRSGNIRGAFQWKDPADLTELKLMLNKCLAEEPGSAVADHPENKTF